MDRIALQTALQPYICVAYFRALRLDVLRWLAVASLPLWYQVASQKVPANVAWMLGFVAATLGTLAVVYAVLECRWGGRARQGRVPLAISRSVNLHEDVRAGLLCAWGLVCLAPCAAVLGAPVPRDLPAALSPIALGVVAARIALEAWPRPPLPPRAAPRGQRAWAGRLGVR